MDHNDSGQPAPESQTKAAGPEAPAKQPSPPAAAPEPSRPSPGRSAPFGIWRPEQAGAGPGRSAAPEPSGESLQELVQRANNGDREALTELRDLLDARPDIWEAAGDLERLSEVTWIEMIAGANLLIKESVRRTIAEMKQELQGSHPAKIEALLIGQIVACWLECQYYQSLSDNPGKGSLAEGALALKRRESAQRRYLNSLKMLAQLRALVPKGLTPFNRYPPHRAAR